MENLNSYLKYYWLEEYLDKDVRSDFEKNHFLTVEQFFCIVQWKVPRFGKLHLKYLAEEDRVKELTTKIYNAKTDREKLELLLKDGQRNRRGIRLAMASAILTILYPDRFTVYDIRVRKQLRKRGLWNEKQDDITNRPNAIDIYFDKYIPAVKKVQQDSAISSFRECDRALWGQDWYEDLKEFISPK